VEKDRRGGRAMKELRASLPLSEYKALRDSLRRVPAALRRAALPQAVKAYLAQVKSSNDEPEPRTARKRGGNRS
jgi:hypothetical protein